MEIQLKTHKNGCFKVSETTIKLSTELVGNKSALRSFIVSFSSLFICPAATLLFWFTLSALIASFWAAAGSCFQRKSCKNPLYTTCSAPNGKQTQLAVDQLVNIVEHLAAKEPDISLRSWQRVKTELKESEYWTYIHQVDRNTTPNE